MCNMCYTNAVVFVFINVSYIKFVKKKNKTKNKKTFQSKHTSQVQNGTNIYMKFWKEEP